MLAEDVLHAMLPTIGMLTVKLVSHAPEILIGMHPLENVSAALKDSPLITANLNAPVLLHTLTTT